MKISKKAIKIVSTIFLSFMPTFLLFLAKSSLADNINVNLDYPPDITINQYDTFWINASVICNAPGLSCGSVDGYARYGSLEPDTLISTVTGTTPFYIIGEVMGIETIAVDTTNDVGQYASIAVDSNDVVHISHHDITFQNLRYCNNAGGVWSCTNADTGANFGVHSSIAIDSNDNVHISHFDSTSPYAIRYCNNIAGSWTCTNVETGIGVSNAHTSIAIDSNDNVHISYHNSTLNNLRYCNNAGGTWTCTNIDSTLGYTSIAIDSNDNIHISHRNTTNNILRYCNNAGGTWTCTDIDSTFGYTSIAIDSNDNVHISHRSTTGDLNYCNNTAGTWACTNVDTGFTNFGFTSIAIDSNDRPHISHHNWLTNELIYCYSNDFSTWDCQYVYQGSVYTNGRGIAIKKGRLCDSTSFSSNVHMSHYYALDEDLMYSSITSNPFSCGIINDGETCNVSWKVNATFSSGSYYVDVNFTSSLATITPNDTSNSRITVGGLDLPPTYSDVGSDTTPINPGDPFRIFAKWSDDTALDMAWLSTNETGDWVNHTGIYGSPVKLFNNPDWSNFTWQNPDFVSGVVGWIIYANDSVGNEANTIMGTFEVISIYNFEAWMEGPTFFTIGRPELVNIYVRNTGNVKDSFNITANKEVIIPNGANHLVQVGLLSDIINVESGKVATTFATMTLNGPVTKAYVWFNVTSINNHILKETQTIEIKSSYPVNLPEFGLFGLILLIFSILIISYTFHFRQSFLDVL